MNDDLISRQAAIDELCNMTVYRDDVGYSMIYRLDAVDKIRALPSAQPEIIRCGECTHKDKKIDYCHYLGITICKCDYCSYAVERITDE